MRLEAALERALLLHQTSDPAPTGTASTISSSSGGDPPKEQASYNSVHAFDEFLHNMVDARWQTRHGASLALRSIVAA